MIEFTGATESQNDFGVVMPTLRESAYNCDTLRFLVGVVYREQLKKKKKNTVSLSICCSYEDNILITTIFHLPTPLTGPWSFIKGDHVHICIGIICVSGRRKVN